MTSDGCGDQSQAACRRPSCRPVGHLGTPRRRNGTLKSPSRPQQSNQPPNGRCRIVVHSPRSDGGFFNNPMIGKLLEQTQIQTTTRYVHLARDSVKASASKIADSIEADVLADNERPDATYASSGALWGPAKPVLEKRGVQRTVFGRTTAIRRLWMCGFLPVRASVPSAR